MKEPLAGLDQWGVKYFGSSCGQPDASVNAHKLGNGRYRPVKEKGTLLYTHMHINFKISFKTNPLSAEKGVFIRSFEMFYKSIIMLFCTIGSNSEWFYSEVSSILFREVCLTIGTIIFSPRQTKALKTKPLYVKYNVCLWIYTILQYIQKTFKNNPGCIHMASLGWAGGSLVTATMWAIHMGEQPAAGPRHSSARLLAMDRTNRRLECTQKITALVQP